MNSYLSSRTGASAHSPKLAQCLRFQWRFSFECNRPAKKLQRSQSCGRRHRPEPAIAWNWPILGPHWPGRGAAPASRWQTAWTLIEAREKDDHVAAVGGTPRTRLVRERRPLERHVWRVYKW